MAKTSHIDNARMVLAGRSNLHSRLENQLELAQKAHLFSYGFYQWRRAPIFHFTVSIFLYFKNPATSKWDEFYPLPDYLKQLKYFLCFTEISTHVSKVILISISKSTTDSRYIKLLQIDANSGWDLAQDLRRWRGRAMWALKKACNSN